jgi:hypothetical protein
MFVVAAVAVYTGGVTVVKKYTAMVDGTSPRDGEAEAKIEEDFAESAVVVPAEDRHLLPLLRDLAVDLDALEVVHQQTFH